MEISAFLTGANVVAFEKNNKRYGMTFAWGMQSDYDKILFLVGSQSETGKHIEIGDVIGVSALMDNQIDLAKLFGTNHSNEINKFNNLDDFIIDDSAIMIKHAKNNMKVIVNKIIDLENSKDLLIYGYVVKATENPGKYLNSENVWQA